MYNFERVKFITILSYISECRYVLLQPYLVVIGGGGEENSTQDQDYDLKHFFPTVDH